MMTQTNPTEDITVEGTSKDSSESTDGSGGAFNPQTGEINWDCPYLGGMAHGPCCPEFREAFSCFVFSEVEPKGIDCVEKFKAMQTCFRAHPDVYADGRRSLPESFMSLLNQSFQKLWTTRTMNQLPRDIRKVYRLLWIRQKQSSMTSPFLSLLPKRSRNFRKLALGTDDLF